MKTAQPQLIEAGDVVRKSGLVHRVWEPDQKTERPTIVMLHGRSGTEDVAWVFARSLPKEWLLIAPRAIHTDHRGGYSWDVRPEGQWPPEGAFDDATEALDQFINSLPDLYNADLSRLYLLGFSQGAAVSYSYARRYANKVKGVAGLVGLTTLDAANSADIINLKDLPIFMAVGRRDTTVPMSIARDCAHALIAGGARLDYREYNTGHKLNSRGMRDLATWWQQNT
ncbi:MAG: alpha/beta hydrolase [Candidatus Promineifilaceae bacterium]